MKLSSGWAAAIIALLVLFLPIITSLIILYSDVQSMKISKASSKTVSKLRIEFTKQLTRNTVAIENLNDTLKSMYERRNHG